MIGDVLQADTEASCIIIMYREIKDIEILALNPVGLFPKKGYKRALLLPAYVLWKDICV